LSGETGRYLGVCGIVDLGGCGGLQDGVWF
jgi:hypothetical protein